MIVRHCRTNAGICGQQLFICQHRVISVLVVFWPHRKVQRVCSFPSPSACG